MPVSRGLFCTKSACWEVENSGGHVNAAEADANNRRNCLRPRFIPARLLVRGIAFRFVRTTLAIAEKSDRRGDKPLRCCMRGTAGTPASRSMIDGYPRIG